MLKSLTYRSLDNTRVVYVTRDREDGSPTFARLTSAQAAARAFVRGKGGRRRRSRQLTLFVDDPPTLSTDRRDGGAADDPHAGRAFRRTRGHRTGDREWGGT